MNLRDGDEPSVSSNLTPTTTLERWLSWLKALAWKANNGESRSRVRIPFSLPFSQEVLASARIIRLMSGSGDTVSVIVRGRSAAPLFFYGRLAERLKALVSKTNVSKGTTGSNPVSTAILR